MKKVNILLSLVATFFLIMGLTRCNSHKNSVPSSTEVKATSAPEKAVESESNIQPTIGTQIGNKAPELNFKTPADKDLALSSLKGKIVLIDFWASWCGPCRGENPNVVRVYNTYKDTKFSKKAKGFTVYSVSLDQNKQAWVNAIAKDGLVWENHVSDLGGWQSKGAAIYGVNSIPAAYLIDENGVIVASGPVLRGPGLENELKKLIK